mmetsp:Transcript_32932/g.74028  ORF Transcript_32932/g.74028 Transcript_32932/m.74028 type:complete len:341 (+) Transcript_32932:80-1102(+)
MVSRSYDAFVKPVEGIRERSVSGGFITLLATLTASILFISQIAVYLKVETRQHMQLADSVPSLLFNKARPKDLLGHRIPLRVHVTFPHVECKSTDYSHDGSAHSSGDFQKHHKPPFAFTRRKPTTEEYRVAAGCSAVTANKKKGEGCTISGTIHVQRVGGTLTMSVSPAAWRDATSLLVFNIDPTGRNAVDPFHGRLPNVTHYIHDVTFGKPFPAGENPLNAISHVMDNKSGVGLTNVAVKLVPTTYKRTFHSERETYQASVSRHFVQPEMLAAQHSSMLPGLLISYDFTPIAVRHVESRENWFVFLSSLFGIVGGVFVTVGLVSGCLVNSVEAVAKKMD